VAQKSYHVRINLLAVKRFESQVSEGAGSSCVKDILKRGVAYHEFGNLKTLIGIKIGNGGVVADNRHVGKSVSHA